MGVTGSALNRDDHSYMYMSAVRKKELVGSIKVIHCVTRLMLARERSSSKNTKFG